MKRLILGALAVAALVASCTAAAHLKVLQPTAVPGSPPLTIPGSTGYPGAPRFQRGIAIDAYTYPGQDIAAAAATDVAYLERLHANAVSISFPFFMAGPRAAVVYATSKTPTPRQLAVLIQDAQRAGLYVSLRPLLDEANLGRAREALRPADPRAWFTSYRRFLIPYARMAQRQHVAELVVGAEFSRFANWPGWNGLDRALRRDFRGTLAYANNWTVSSHMTGNGGQPARETVDAYQPQHIPLLAGWVAFDHSLPRGTVETEVGIDAVAGAYTRPYQHYWATTVLEPQIQARWFGAACRAAAETHLGGIYFWSLGFSSDLSGPSLTNQGAWALSPGAAAISRCFVRLGKTSR